MRPEAAPEARIPDKKVESNLGNASLARSELPPASPAHRYFQQIENAALRAVLLSLTMPRTDGEETARDSKCLARLHFPPTIDFSTAITPAP